MTLSNYAGRLSRHFERYRSANRIQDLDEHTSGTGSWMILHQAENPTTDYYIKPEIARHGETYQTRLLSSPPQSTEGVKNIVVVRYLNDGWGRWLKKNKHQFERIIFFMDDELMTESNWENLPTEYRKKLAVNLTCLRKWLKDVVDEYWVSTRTLRATNPQLNAVIIHPAQLPGDAEKQCRAPDASRSKLIFYHATASHREEFIWLKPIIQYVMKNTKDSHFEVIGDFSVNKLFRDIPRTRVLHPMSWPNYLSYTSTVSGGLGLAPLLDTPFNRARSTVKRYDLLRMNASIVYSEGSPYADLLERKSSNFVTLRNDPEVWQRYIEDWLKARN